MITLLVDPAGRLISANGAGRRLRGWYGQQVRSLTSLTHAGERPAVADLMALATRRERSAGMIAVKGSRTSQGSAAVRHLQLLLTRTSDRVPSHASDMGVFAVSVQGWDITSRYFGHQQRRSDDMQDQRISLENRAAFTSCLETELARWHRRDERLALLVAVVGLPAGDDGNRADVVEGVRIAMARRLRLAMGAGDTVMRIGPGSFAIMCRGLGGWPALSLVLERLHAVDHDPVDLFGEEVWGSVSVSAIFADEAGHGQVSARALLGHLGLGEGTTGP